MIKITPTSFEPKNVTVEQLEKNTRIHAEDVKRVGKFMADRILDTVSTHDHTKFERMEDFHRAITGGKVKDSDWYRYHVNKERHHLKTKIPDDVNLFDVLEYAADITCAGLARSGTVYDDDPDPKMLELAFANTIKLLKENISTDVMDTKID